MFAVLTAFHVLICFLLVGAVLLQSGQGGGLAGAFGGQGGAQTIFGGRGAATFLSKATAVLGALFLLSALTLAVVPRPGEGPTKSVVREKALEAQQEAPEPQAPASPANPVPEAGTLPPERAAGSSEAPGKGNAAPQGAQQDKGSEKQGGEQ